MFYFACILFYVTLTHEFSTNDDVIKSHPTLSHATSHPWTKPWDIGHLILGILIIIQSCYFLVLEIRKWIKTGLSYHLFIEIVFYIFALGLVCANFAGANDT
jgi:hypothetical protein